MEREITLKNDAQKKKFVLGLERIIRSSMEYKDYVAFLRQYIDMTQCSFFHDVKKGDRNSGKISIEIHHEPFKLYTITLTIVNKWMAEEIPLNRFGIAEEVMKIHYQNLIGLIPLSKTVHQLVEKNRLFVPLQSVRGNFINFLKQYDPYIPESVKEGLKEKLAWSQDLSKHDTSILETHYIYIDGFSLPMMPKKDEVETETPQIEKVPVG